MALPIRPTPVLTGKNAERLDAYMAESEFAKASLRNIPIDWDKLNECLIVMRNRKLQGIYC